MRHHAVVALILLTVAPGGAPARPNGGRVPRPAPVTGAARPAEPGAVAYVAPTIPLRVVRPFQPPAGQYGPGHRGVDLRTGVDSAVRSAGAGIVRFAGAVGGRGVIVVAHADGISTEYEPVTSSVRAGTAVRAGQLIGHLHGAHAGCSGPCLHWGARRLDDYLDPLTLLRPLGPVVLLPWLRGG